MLNYQRVPATDYSREIAFVGKYGTPIASHGLPQVSYE